MTMGETPLLEKKKARHTTLSDIHLIIKQRSVQGK